MGFGSLPMNRRARRPFVAIFLIVPLFALAQPATPVEPAPVPVAAIVPPAGEQIELRLNLQAGDDRIVRQSTEQIVELGPEDRPVRLRYTTGYDIRWDVLTPAADGNLRVRWTFERAMINQSTPEGATAYDSSARSGQPVPAAALLHAAIPGQAIEATLSPRGDVVALDGVDALQRHLESAMTGLDAGASATLRATMETQFSAEALRETALLSLPVMPPNAVAVGSDWGRQQRLDNGVPIDLNATYRLVERRDGRALVESMAMLATATDQTTGPDAMTLELAGDQRGRLEVDETKGWIIAARYEQQLRGVSRAVQTGANGEEMIVETPTRLRTVTTIETVGE